MMLVLLIWYLYGATGLDVVSWQKRRNDGELSNRKSNSAPHCTPLKYSIDGKHNDSTPLFVPQHVPYSLLELSTSDIVPERKVILDSLITVRKNRFILNLVVGSLVLLQVDDPV
jgi:hypothetical protein